MGLLPENMNILPPSDDRVFKLILTAPDAKPALLDLITTLIGRKVVDVLVRNNEIPAEDTEEKAQRLDLNCVTEDCTQINIEMQAQRIIEEMDGRFQNVIGKSVYYLCDLHSSQSAKGVKRYDRLAHTYQVTFCNYTIFPGREEFVNSFSLRHDRDNGLLTDAVHEIFVELSKLKEALKKPVDEMTELEKWSVFFRYAGESMYRNTVNEVIASKEALQVAGNLLMSISQDERERAIYRSRRMYETDLLSNLTTAEDRGRREGERKGRREVAIRMLRRNRSIEIIDEDTGLPRSEIEKLQRELQSGTVSRDETAGESDS